MMNRIVKILFAIFILLIIFAITTNLTQLQENDVEILDEYTTVLGSNSNGTVYKITCGNNSSNDTAILILGVHALEGGIHNATNESIITFTKENDLNRNYIVYFIKLNYKDSGMNISDYTTNRHMGEMLANEYVVPDIENYDPYIVVDVHEMEDYWEKQEYVGVMDNESDLEVEYAYRIGNNLSYPVLTINAGTSPEWVTIPIENNNHVVILFETPQKDSFNKKMQIARDLIKTIDTLPIY